MITIPGAEFYLCGGAVRDKLMGKEPHDKDYVVITSIPYYDLIVTLVKAGCDVLVHEPDFFTIRVMLPDKEVVDIVYPRKEGGYIDGRHPENVTLAQTLEEDSKRRDFTINALYMASDGTVIDYCNGQEDIRKGIIRCVSEPNISFGEDYLRVLRAFRFKQQFKFNLDPETYFSAVENIPNLEKISVDRIRDELNKILRVSYFIPNFLYEASMWQVMEKKGLRFEVTAKR
jgi:tRNA nucleotidyltransferase (CCA-adding enzyme)